MVDRGPEKPPARPDQPAGSPGRFDERRNDDSKPVNVEDLADRVYRMMLAQARLERARMGRD